MSLVYRPRHKAVEPFDVNSMGADILGDLHSRLGLPVEPRRQFDGPHRVPYAAKAADCRAWAEHIGLLYDDVVRDAFEFVRPMWDKNETANDWLDWVRKWQEFLANCRGYRAI